MKLLKPNNKYPFKSNTITILKLPFLKIDIEEYYDPHYLEIRFWIKERNEMLFLLRNWIKIPLDKYMIAIIKTAKAESRYHKQKAKLEKLYSEKESLYDEREFTSST